ncbi:MAG: YhbY family RNA-binding protein [Desulfobacterales bacterium]|nr:YhbY family RNA-binding protein [Desulfobacterales bacterium]
MQALKGFQKTWLRGRAHDIKPVVFIGQKGLSPAVIEAAGEALDTHELIKVKFQDFKDKEQKQTIAQAISEQTGSELVGMIGHMAIFFRQHPEPEKQKFQLPDRAK